MERVVAGYVACLLQFGDEPPDVVLDRVYQYGIRGFDATADFIINSANAGQVLTARALYDTLGVEISQQGLSPNQIPTYYQAVQTASRRKALLNAASRIKAVADGKDTETLATIVESVDTTPAVNAIALEAQIEVGDSMYHRLLEEKNSGLVRASFPWNGINTRLPFLYDDDLIVLSGQSKSGKSAAAHQIALWNARFMPVAYFHNEDDPLRVHLRRLAQIQAALDRTFSKNELTYPLLLQSISAPETAASIDGAIERANNYIKQNLKNNIWYIYCPGWTPEQIVQQWRVLRRQHGRMLVIVDYLNKIELGHLLKARSLAAAYEYAVELFKRECGRSGYMSQCVLVQQENEDGTVRDTRGTYIKAQAHLSLQRDAHEGDAIVLERCNSGSPGKTNAQFYAPYLWWRG